MTLIILYSELVWNITSIIRKDLINTQMGREDAGLCEAGNEWHKVRKLQKMYQKKSYRLRNGMTFHHLTRTTAGNRSRGDKVDTGGRTAV